MRQKLSTVYSATAIDEAMFIATDLYKYTRCEDAIKSSLKKALTSLQIFKGNRTVIAMLRTSEYTKGSEFWYDKIRFIFRGRLQNYSEATKTLHCFYQETRDNTSMSSGLLPL